MLTIHLPDSYRLVIINRICKTLGGWAFLWVGGWWVFDVSPEALKVGLISGISLPICLCPQPSSHPRGGEEDSQEAPSSLSLHLCNLLAFLSWHALLPILHIMLSPSFSLPYQHALPFSLFCLHACTPCSYLLSSLSFLETGGTGKKEGKRRRKEGKGAGRKEEEEGRKNQGELLSLSLSLLGLCSSEEGEKKKEGTEGREEPLRSHLSHFLSLSLPREKNFYLPTYFYCFVKSGGMRRPQAALRQQQPYRAFLDGVRKHRTPSYSAAKHLCGDDVT